jgi:magnesium-transporting ATPase (P-type)
MFLGTYSNLYESAISPWTTWGPLAVVIAISLSVEGSADAKRHRNDEETNNAVCVVLRRADEIDAEQADSSGGARKKKKDETGIGTRDEHILKGKDVKVNINKHHLMASGVAPETSIRGPNIVNIGFQKTRRMNVRQGHFVLIKNREMVPADILLLASSNDQGGAYIETSSIDGETNLKLRTSPTLPKAVVKAFREGMPSLQAVTEEDADSEEGEDENNDSATKFETIEAATKRIARFSYLGHPTCKCALDHPEYSPTADADAPPPAPGSPSRRTSRLGKVMDKVGDGVREGIVRRHGQSDSFRNMEANKEQFVAALVSEPPNASVHTFSGKLVLPPLTPTGEVQEIPLGAENVLLRGAVLRNTEWAIGVAFFTGNDTKLIQNSHKTPPKFSQLDILMNWTVLCILVVMALTIGYLATSAHSYNTDAFETLFYAGFSSTLDEPWPYLPPGFAAPDWETKTYNWVQYYLLYITLLTNFVPLSLYVTVEVVTVVNLWFIYADLDMYDDTSDTRAVARSTIITDLGRIQYIFSDKTGTLTQNVMRFKRCSVDGMVFGAPIQKSRPGAPKADDEDDEPSSFHPLRQLLVGQFKRGAPAGLEGLGGRSSQDSLDNDNKLTFNAEMFLRVMSLCHTVVVEKDIDNKQDIDAATSVNSVRSSGMSFFSRKRSNTSDSPAGSIFGRIRANTGDSIGTPLSSVRESGGIEDIIASRARAFSHGSLAPGQNPKDLKGPDGAPYGYAYQAESPDEGALVTAASSTFGFQVINRDASGVTLRTSYQSHLQVNSTLSGLKDGTLSLKKVAAESAAHIDDETLSPHGSFGSRAMILEESREEKWQILAVNKFDSDRKRMSILLRAPPELGGLPILFCKGADSAMLDPAICSSSQMIQDGDDMGRLVNIPKPPSVSERDRDVSALTTVSEGAGNSRDSADDCDIDPDGWEIAQMLGVQSHLGDFAREGLRTLVLGMRILSEDECEEWLGVYKAAAVTLGPSRDDLLTEAAKNVERNLHIVGATAIEDKLQVGVPHTIAQLEKAGIKLWVLTGDKRETAVEIGYSTNVLTPKMHLTEVPDNGETHVRTQMAMEFIRLIKLGKLSEYQKASLEDKGRQTMKTRIQRFQFIFGKLQRKVWRYFLSGYAAYMKTIGSVQKAKDITESVVEMEEDEAKIVEDVARRRTVRARAERIIQDWIVSDEGRKNAKDPNQDQSQGESDDELSLASGETPAVFQKASSAKSLLKSIRISGNMSQPERRKLSIAHLTAQQASEKDTLSLESFFVGNNGPTNDFDKKKRTLLERMFAIDKEVRKGRLKKHMTASKLATVLESEALERSARAMKPSSMSDGPRALVIEGAALKSLLGDPDLEEILFAVASKCEAVIACRVSPKQKALLVNLVRRNVKPEPVTLAIGDGANDVGMIQEAHVGVGISGKEGKQAVNASDFSIAQFRFLEELILIHGRWNFFRLSNVVLFSFYKNAVMAGTLVVYADRTLYSGTPLFDEWVIAMLNFVATFPILFLGLFDRCLGKDYVKANPQVFKATRENELITFRTLLRWVVLVFVHIFAIYYMTVPQHADGGGMTSAWNGLMSGRESSERPGDGEGGDLKSVGAVSFTVLIVLLAYKVRIGNCLVHDHLPRLFSLMFIPSLCRFCTKARLLFTGDGQPLPATKIKGKAS